MSRGVALDTISELSSYDDAARLLSSLCPDSIKDSVANKLGSPESFACLLHRHTPFFDKVKRALISRDFDDVWATCVRYVQPMKGIHAGIKEIPGILSQISSDLQDLVKGKTETPLWTLSQAMPEETQPFVKRFTLRSLMEQTRMPSMLFYNLGSFKSNDTLSERIQNLFCKNKNTFLVNASATGKTRLLYEGLLQHWGFYITARADDREGQALEAALRKTFGGEDGMMKVLPNKSALGYRTLLDDNLEFLNRRFSIVLLTHLLVFREFLRTAHAESITDDQNLRCAWLLAQLWQPCLGGEDDIYKEILESLESEPLTVIREELANVLDDVKLLLPAAMKTEGLFVAIDEANVAAKQIWYDAAEIHPPIRSMICNWRDTLASLECPVTFVVAGTEISSETFPSSSPEWSSWKWTSDTGSFDDPEVQKNYILPFLPPSYADTPSGEVLLRRIWDWCRPRHRLTTAIIEMLIEDKVTHPHGVLDRYVQRLTSYKPSDAAAFVAEEGPCKITPFFNPIGQLVKDNPFARSATHEVVFHYIITGTHPRCYDYSRLAVVTSGVGQFKDKDMQVIALDQPGPTVAAAIWLGHDQGVGRDKPDGLRSLRLFQPFSHFFNLTWPNGVQYSPAGYIALYLANALVKGLTMSDMFSIPGTLWSKDVSTPAQLLVLRRDTHGVLQELIVGSSALLSSSPPLGYRANTLDDVIAWLNQERIGAFCLCPSECRAELIFVLKLKEKYTWVMLRTVGRQTQPQTKGLYPEFEYLTVEHLFSSVTDATVYRERLSDALSALPNTLASPGSFPVLRVLASFPTEPSLPRNVTQKIRGDPVGVLKLDTFKTVTEAFSPDDLIEGLVHSMHDKRSTYTDDLFHPIQTIPKSRKGKRKDNIATQSLSKPSTEAPNEVTSNTDRPMRPIPRYKSPPSSPRLNVESPAPLAQAAMAEEPVPLPSVPKRVKKKGQGSETFPPVHLRRSPREFKAKSTSGK